MKNLRMGKFIDFEKSLFELGFFKRKSTKSRWGNLPIDYSKCKQDSSSTSHLVESAETTSIHTNSTAPPIPSRPSALNPLQNSANFVSLSYRQASALPGFRPLDEPYSNSMHRRYDDDDENDGDSIRRPIPMTNRSRTTTPLGSHRSLSESIQSLRSNQQPPLVLPMKKRSNETSTTKSDYQNMEQLKLQQQQMVKADPPPPPLPSDDQSTERGNVKTTFFYRCSKDFFVFFFCFRMASKKKHLDMNK